MKRLLLMLLCMCLLLGGCGAKQAEEERGDEPGLLLGFAQLGWESAWRWVWLGFPWLLQK